uniref:Uncharacterized protein n=1 Tax=Picea sitchensis TaxID=3332 RepID=A0A6B9XQX4_PICSI|nr:hypothetical protein Q903MT_gene4011 [Picea sitchensis]
MDFLIPGTCLALGRTSGFTPFLEVYLWRCWLLQLFFLLIKAQSIRPYSINSSETAGSLSIYLS